MPWYDQVGHVVIRVTDKGGHVAIGAHGLFRIQSTQSPVLTPRLTSASGTDLGSTPLHVHFDSN